MSTRAPRSSSDDSVAAKIERYEKALREISDAVFDVWDGQYSPQDRLSVIDKCARTALGECVEPDRALR